MSILFYKKITFRKIQIISEDFLKLIINFKSENLALFREKSLGLLTKYNHFL